VVELPATETKEEPMEERKLLDAPAARDLYDEFWGELRKSSLIQDKLKECLEKIEAAAREGKDIVRIPAAEFDLTGPHREALTHQLDELGFSFNLYSATWEIKGWGK